MMAEICRMGTEKCVYEIHFPVIMDRELQEAIMIGTDCKGNVHFPVIHSNCHTTPKMKKLQSFYKDNKSKFELVRLYILEQEWNSV